MILLSTKLYLSGFCLAFVIYFLRVLAGHNGLAPLLIMIPFFVSGWVVKKLEVKFGLFVD
jgi:hypothetical protein